MQERRQHIRLNKSFEVSYRISNQLIQFSSRSVDISIGGICLSAPQRLEPGTVFQLELRPTGVKKSIAATGKVMWLKERNDAQFPFEIGIKFIRIAPSDIKILDNLCRKLEEERSTDIKHTNQGESPPS